ncbi:MAG: hypothetical protein ACTSP4_04645 [Candidatus Hodarchaeales archaeon]
MSSSETTAASTSRPRSTKARRHRSQKRIRKDLADEELRETFKQKKGRDANARMYYTKVVTGAVTGLIAGIFFMLTNGSLSGVVPNPDPTGIRSWWLIFPLCGLIVSMLITRYIWNITPEEIDKKRLVLSGTFSLIAIFVFISSISWMILTELASSGYIMQLVNLGK